MKQYIDKAAIMAEIKRYKHKADERLKIKGRTLAEDLKDLALQNLCRNLIHTLDTIEVKEIDFDLGSPNGDIGVKTIWDGDKVVSVSEPSNNLEEAAKKAGQKYFPDENNIWARPNYEAKAAEYAFKDGAKWQKEYLWKPADGNDLPEIDSEVIALVEENEHYKAVFAHRPPEYWDGKNIITNEITRYYPKRYDKGGWNQPNVKWWLDLDLPKMQE